MQGDISFLQHLNIIYQINVLLILPPSLVLGPAIAVLRALIFSVALDNNFSANTIHCHTIVEC